MKSPIFFKKKSFLINKLFPNRKFKKNIQINDVKILKIAQKNDLTFFDSLNISLMQKILKHYIVLQLKDCKNFCLKPLRKLL